MRPFHLTLGQILGFVLALGCMISSSAEQLQNQPGSSGVMSQSGAAPGSVPARPPKLHLPDSTSAGEPGAWDQKAPKRKADLAQLNTESQELQKLAASLPDKLAKMQDGVLPADLISNLKKIEKLSKHIRAEIQ